MQCATIKKCLPHLLILGSLLLSALPANAAPKTDTVLFNNGDKLTGEFKSLKRGRLSLNTEATGTIGIEWDKVSNVISKQIIQVELTDGTRYFGELMPTEKSSSIVILTGSGPQLLEMTSIITMTPIEGGGIHALDVDLSVGYDFAKAGGVKHASLGIDMDYRSLVRIESLRFSTLVTDSDSQDSSQRTSLLLGHTRLWSKRWFTTGSLSFDQNDELGLDLRSSVGGSVGRYRIQSNSMLLSLTAGVQFSRENLTTNVDDIDSFEATFSLDWDWFLFEDPELDLSLRFELIPSLTEKGRVRSELSTTLSWEIIGDLDWALSYYGSWDNQPQSTEGATSDYGINTALVYEF